MMELEKCFEILDLQPGAGMEEIKAAYRDAVSVWHPDRFSHNLRLRKKAERKIKEINEAYETLMSRISGYDSQLEERGDRSQSHVEAIAEVSTRVILHACHYLIKRWKGS
ncbi:MAG: hypothetical protein DRG63_03580 [Deltaproteobacteria bacterium]|nr:MAG: hypothetical protein DRG63_03580 [Deltaproteobacteria bacterium]